jgi:outer membrane protein assembly factor BamA
MRAVKRAVKGVKAMKKVKKDIQFKSAKSVQAFTKEVIASELQEAILKSAKDGSFSLSTYRSITEDLIDRLKRSGYQLEWIDRKVGYPQMLKISWERTES